MNTFLLTTCREMRFFGLWNGNHPVTLQRIPEKELPGSIYIGTVSNISRNIKAAFVSFGEETDGFLSLEDGPFLRADGAVVQEIKTGDSLLVQVTKEAAGIKPPTLSGHITLTGHRCILTALHNKISVSAKIRDSAWRKNAKEHFATYCGDDYGFILRTESYQAAEEEIAAEMTTLAARYQELKQKAAFRKEKSLLKKGESSYLKALVGMNAGQLDQIVTDLPEIAEDLKEKLAYVRPDLAPLVRVYEGSPSPAAVYAVDAELDRALQRKVYLPCGGYLIIDPTEAMTVIDVNSGKNSLNKTGQEAFLAVNREAAREVCRQIRLRNLSGIIVVDFVNLKREEDRQELGSILAEELRKDPVPAQLVDFTGLYLAEITRKKVYKPLREQV